MELVLLFMVGGASLLRAADRYAVADGTWASTNTWSTTSGGSSGASAPMAGDVVYIEGGKTVTISAAAAACANLYIASGSTLNVGHTLTVSGTTTIDGTLNLSATTGTKTFAGLVTINAGIPGGAWTESAASAVTFNGGITNNGTFTASTGVHTFSVTQALTGTISIPSLTVTGASVTLTNNNTLTVGTALAGTGGLTQASNAVLNIGGTSAIATLDATTNSNTVNYTGAAQTVKAVDYNNLTLSGSGIKTLNAAITSVSGNFVLSGTASATLLANLSVGGDLNIGTGTALTLGTFTANRSASGGTLTVAGTLNIAGANTFPSNYATKDFTGGTVNYNGAVQTVAGENYNNLTLSTSGAKTMPGGLMTLSGSLVLSGTVSATLVANVSIAGDLNIGTGTTLTLSTFTANRAASGGTLTIAGTLNVGGSSGGLNAGNNFPNNFSAITNTGTVNYNGTGAQTVSAIDYTNLTISGARGGGEITLQSGTMYVSGTLSTTATVTTYVTAGNTINLSGAAQTIGGAGSATSFGNITTSGSGAKTTTGNFNIDGNLTVGSGTTFGIGATTITVGGTTTVDNGGTLNVSSNSGTKIFVGAVTVNGTWSNVNESIEFRGGLAYAGTAFTAGTGVYSFTTNTQGLSGTLSIPSVTVTGITLTNNGSLTVATALAGVGGTLTQAMNATLNLGGTSTITTLNAAASGNTVNYQGAAQTVNVSTFHHLTLSGSGTKTMPAGVTAINGNFTLGGTATATAGAGLTIGGNVDIGSGTTFGASTFTHNVAGNFTNSGTFTAGTSTMVFNGATAQTLTGATTFNKLTLNNSAGLTINDDVTVNSVLALTSGVITTGANKVVLASTGSISGASAAKYINGTLERNFTGAVTSGTFPIGNASTYAPITLTFSTVNTDGSVTASTTEGDHPNLAGSGLPTNRSLNRYWSLTNNGVGFDDYSITARAASSGELDAAFNGSNVAYGKYSGGSWETGTTTYVLSGTPMVPTFNAALLTTMSDFAFASCAAAGTGGSTTVCSSGTPLIITLASHLTGQDAGGTWARTAGTGGIFSDEAGTFDPAGASDGAHTFTYTFAAAGSCALSSATVTVQVSSATTTAAAGSDISSCATTVTLAANAVAGGETGAWTIQSGTGGSFSAASSPTSNFTGVVGNTYTLRWTISGACTASYDEMTVAITNDLPVVNTVSVAANPTTTAAISWTLGNTPGFGSTYDVLATNSATAPTALTTPTATGILTTTYNASVSPGTAYYIYVRGVCGTTKGAWVAAASNPVNTLCDVTENPTFTSFTNIATTTATINWTNGGSSTLTDIYIVLTGSAAPLQTTAPTHNNLTGATYNKTGLTSGAAYDVYFRGNCGAGNAFGSAWVGPHLLSMQCASTATALAATNATAATAAVSWTDATASSWDIYLRAPGDPAPVTATVPTVLAHNAANYNFAGLTANTAYSFYVRKYCGSPNTNTSAWSAAASFTTACATSTQPTPGALTVNSATSATFTWTNNGGSTVTDLYINTTNTAPASITPPTHNNLSGTSYTKTTGLTANTTYYYWMRGNCGASNVNGSEWVFGGSFSTLCGTVPTALTLTDIAANSATVSWTGGAGEIYLVTAGGAAPTNATVPTHTPATSPYTLTSLNDNASYDYYVRTTCTPGTMSAWSAKGTFKTLCAAASNPTPGAYTNLLSSSVTVNWANNNGSARTDIYLSTTNTAPASTLTTLTAPSVSDVATVATRAFTGLTPGTTYYVWLRGACTTTNNTAWVSADNFTTTTCAITVPTSPTATVLSSTSVSLSWTQDNTNGTPATWDVYRGTTATAPANGTAPTYNDVTNPYTVTGLAANTTYYFWVRANCGGGDYTDWSATSTGAVKTLCANTPTALANSNLTTDGTSATISWNQTVNTLAAWDLYVSTSATAPLISATPTHADIVGTTVSPSNPFTYTYNLTGLIPNTTYYVWVRSKCAPGNNYSAWAAASTTFLTCRGIADNTTSTDAICEGTTKELIGTPAGGTWSIESLTTAGEITGSGPTYYYSTGDITANETVTIRYTIPATATCAETMEEVTFMVKERPTSTITSSDQFCSGSISITLTGIAPWNLTYSNGTTTTDVTEILSSPHVISGLGVGTYTVTALGHDNECAGTSMTGTASIYPVRNVTSGNFYSTIQSAIDAATAGDVIEVCAGTFTENVTIDKSLDIRGANYNVNPNTGVRGLETILASTSGSNVNVATTNPVSLNGFKFANSGGAFNYSVTGVVGTTISLSHNIWDNAIGVYLPNADLTTIVNNRCTFSSGADEGFALFGDYDGSTGTIIDVHDNVWINGQMTGMNLSSCSGSVHNNTFSNIAYYGILVANQCDLNIYENEFINIANPNNSVDTWGAGIRFWEGFAGNMRANIHNNTFSGNYVAIAARAAADFTGTNVTIKDNSFTNSTTFEIRHNGSGTLATTCNWFGTANGNTIATKVIGNVTYSPWLIGGGDGAGMGFQPTDDCDGTPVVIASATPTIALCGTGASIKVTFSGGTGPYDIAWTGGSATGITSPYTISNLNAGTYTVTVTDANLSSTSTTVIISSYPIANTTTGVGYNTIQAAVTAATAGDVIEVCAGTYAENISINKSLTLNGANAGTSGCGTRVAESVVQGSFSIDADGITVDGFEFTGANAQVASTTGATVRSNISVVNNYFHATTAQIPIRHGLGLGGGIGSMNWTVSNNRIEDIQFGSATAIALFNITNATVEDNCISHTNAAYDGRRGINADGLQTATISGNTINLGGDPTTNVPAVWLIQISMSDRDAQSITIDGNTISNAYFGISTLSQRNVTGLTVMNNVIGPVSLGVTLNGGGATPAISQPVQSNINIANNAITTVTPTISGGIGAGVRLRNLHEAHANGPVTFSNVSANNNSFTVPSGALAVINNYAPYTLNATCNWYGSIIANNVAAQINGNVTYAPYLVDGTDNSGSIGFQPLPDVCTGTPVVIASATPDHITCVEASNSGAINVAFSGGVANYTVAWTGGTPVSGLTGGPYNIAGLTAGTYTITVTDANGSSTTATATVEYQPVHNTTANTYHATIQAAVTAATAGDVLSVCAGTFTENVTVNKSLEIRGANYGTPGCGTRGAESVVAGGVGTAFTITANGVAINGFEITGVTGVASTGYTNLNIINNKFSVAAAGVNAANIATSGGNTLTVESNCITVLNQVVAGPTTTVGIFVNGAAGTQPIDIYNNTITNPFYGILLYGLNTTSPSTVQTNTVTGTMQALAVVNTIGGPLAPSNIAVTSLNANSFTGDYPSLPAQNFHAGVYTFTAGGTTAVNGINLTVDNSTFDGTGKPNQSSAGIYLADFSGGATNVQTVTVTNTNVLNNKNRGVIARGKVNLTLNTSTLTNNGYDAWGTGGNDGFSVIAQNDATVSASNNFITLPATSTTPVYGLSTGNGASNAITAMNNSILLNGNANPSSKLANAAPGTGAITATCNWWDVACSNLPNFINGTVTYQPFLSNGTDGNGAPGFQPAGTCNSYIATLSGVTPSASPVCEGSTISFTANGLIDGTNEFNYTVTGPGGPFNGTQTVTVTGGTYTFPAATYPPGTYDITVNSITINGCTIAFSSGNTAMFTVNALPIIDNPGSKTACDSYTLPAITGTNLVNAKYYNDSKANNGVEITDPVLTATQTVWIYDQTGTVPNCWDEESFLVTINKTPVIDNPGSKTACDSYTLPAITGTNLVNAKYYNDSKVNNGVEITDLVLTATQTVWIYDETGTAPNCSDEEYFLVTINVCLNGKLIAYNTNPDGVGTALVSVTGAQTGSMTTAADGLFNFAFGTGGNYTIAPTKNINRKNGVNAADVSRIQQHIAGTNPFPNGYLMVAADVNKSNTINGTDVTLINQAVLDLTAANFNTSWRFVPTSHTMAIPPWGFPETRTLTGITTSQSNLDFYGIKLGDVVTTFANPANFTDKLVWYAQDQWLKTNEYVDVDFKPGALQDLMAFQFALQFDPGILEYVGHTNYGVLPMNDGCYGTVNVQDGTLRLLFAESKGYKVSGEAPVFRLRFKVRSGGRKLSNALSVDFEDMQAVAYNSKFVEHDLHLEFIEPTTAITEAEHGRGTILYQNRPNPFNGRTEVRFKLPETTQATLAVYDVTGRTVFERSAVFSEGEHAISVELSGVTSGLLYYRLTTPAGQWVRKMENINED